MRFAVGCELAYEIQGQASMVLNLRPAVTAQQKILRESLTLTPDIAVESYTMPESGNRYDRLKLAAGPLAIRYEALVELEVKTLDPATVPEVQQVDLPLEVLPHLYPSRYCQSDRFVNLACKTFGESPRGHLRVTEVCNWVYDHLDYQRGTSDEHTSAIDTLVDRAGVCRDFAHMGVTLCRALGIPARFASCYAQGLEPPDFHAVFEAYLGDRWYLFDATRQAALDGLVRIGVGRDASEVAFTTLNGPIQPTDMKVWIDAEGGADETAPRAVDAVTTAAA